MNRVIKGVKKGIRKLKKYPKDVLNDIFPEVDPVTLKPLTRRKQSRSTEEVALAGITGAAIGAIVGKHGNKIKLAKKLGLANAGINIAEKVYHRAKRASRLKTLKKQRATRRKNS